MGKQKYFINPGETYGLWKVIEKVDGSAPEKWSCVCECGVSKDVHKSHLYSGASKCCGCVGDAKVTERNQKHDLSYTSEHSSWKRIKQRCYNINSPDYKDYGAVGILVDEVWRNSFEQFYKDMGPKPEDGQRWSVGRVDNSKGYAPDNCRWETDEQQARNKNMFITNTSGKTGVSKRVRDGRISFTAVWVDLNRKKHTREFSAGKYGMDGARQLAEKTRDKAIAELNALGAGYSDNHGK